MKSHSESQSPSVFREDWPFTNKWRCWEESATLEDDLRNGTSSVQTLNRLRPVGQPIRGSSGGCISQTPDTVQTEGERNFHSLTADTQEGVKDVNTFGPGHLEL